MTSEHMEQYKSKGIDLHYLVKTDHSRYAEKANEFAEDGCYYECLNKTDGDYTVINIPNRMDTRRLVDSCEYKNGCDELWNGLKKKIGNIVDQKILVVGTEEFMFPAFYVGEQLEKEGNQVFCHSTTRSPIAVSLEKDYPLHCRYELKSLYDEDRKTFIYDIGKYDRVFVITDSPEIEESQRTLINALRTQNKNISLVRWC